MNADGAEATLEPALQMHCADHEASGAAIIVF
jgi:hypothetical protein